MMLSYDYFSCVPKLDGCIIPLEMQDDETMADYWDDEKQRYFCPECLPGYFWSETEYNCIKCSDSIENCAECITGDRCTKCLDAFFPNYLEDECIRFIENCKATPENYVHDGKRFVCPDCSDGFMVNSNSGLCELCEIDNCLGCDSVDFCNQCEFPYLLHNVYDAEDEEVIG